MEYPVIIPALVTSVFLISGVVASPIDQADLETQFKDAYEKFRRAVVTKDEAQLKSSMAPSAYVTMKNQGIAHKMDFPRDFFEGMGGKLHSGLEISKLKSLRALEKNDTGLLVMLALKSAAFDPFGMGGDPRPMLLVFSFIKDAGAWKFNTLSMEGLDDAEETQLLKGDLSKLDADKFRPTGIVPSVPPEEPFPDYDYDAVLNVVFGSEVEVTLNGKAFPKVNGSSSTRTGVKKGENTIVIKSAAASLKVSIYAGRNDADPVKVFDLDLANPDPVITRIFRVDF